MSFLKEYKIALILLFFISVLYFFTRLYHLDSLPIFTDEAIYMWWAQTGKIDATWRFISLVDGKGPFYIWLSMAAMYGIKDPLIAGRIISVFAGFFSVIGLFLIGNELFKNKWVGLISALLYVVYPFALVLDRMALYDTLVTTIVVWAFYIEILLIKKIHSTLAFILALVMGAGMLTKSNAFFTAALLPTTLLLFKEQKSVRLRKFKEWVFFAGIAVGLAYVYYSILRLTPFFSIIATKNAEFVYPISEWIHHPFVYFIGNVQGMWGAIMGYVQIPLLLVIVSAFFVTRSFFKEKLLLLCWFAAPIGYLAFFGKLIYPRHYFFATIFLLPLAAFAIVYLLKLIKNKILFSVLFLFVLGFSLYSEYFILTDIAHAPIPHSDKDQYVTGWSSGGGVKEAIAYFTNEAKDKKISVVTQGTFGLMPYALEIYLRPNKNIHMTGIWPITDEIPKDILANSRKVPTYFLFYQACPQCSYIGDVPPLWPLQLVLKVKKSENIYLTVYKVIDR